MDMAEARGWNVAGAIVAIAESVGSGGINSTVTVYDDEKPVEKWLIVVTSMQMESDHD